MAKNRSAAPGSNTYHNSTEQTGIKMPHSSPIRDPIPMPLRNTVADEIARAADKCLRLACAKHFGVVKLGDYADVVSGGTPDTGNEIYWGGDVVWITPKDLGRPRNVEVTESERTITDEGLAASSARLLPVGTVTLSSRAPIGHLGITDVPLATNQGFKNIICTAELNNRYAFHVLRASIEELQDLGRGNTFREIPARVVTDFEVPLPPLDVQLEVANFLDAVYLRVSGDRIELPDLPVPISEQRRIVARIEELASRVEEARRLREELQKELNALWARFLHDTFEPYANYQVPIGSVFRVTTGGTPSRNNPAYWGGDVKWVSSGEVAFCRIADTRERITELGVRESNAKLCASGTVLLAMIGQGKTRGQCAILNCDAAVNQNVAAIHVDETTHSPEYVYWWLYSRYQESRRSETGTAQPALSGRRVGEMNIPLPPVDEQLRVVSRLEIMHQKIGSLFSVRANGEALYDALLPSILDKAFKGEL